MEILYCWFSLWFLVFPLVCLVCTSAKMFMKPRGLTIRKAVLLPGLISIVKNKALLLFCFFTQFSSCVLPSSLLLLASPLLGFSGFLTFSFFLLRKIEEKDSLFLMCKKRYNYCKLIPKKETIPTYLTFQLMLISEVLKLEVLCAV